MKITEDYVSFETAKLLKEKGFNEPCLKEYYINGYLSNVSIEARYNTIDNQVSANKSANWNNFLENLQSYFDNQRNRNMANESYGRIFDYTNATNGSGHILYGENKKKKKTKKNKR